MVSHLPIGCQCQHIAFLQYFVNPVDMSPVVRLHIYDVDVIAGESLPAFLHHYRRFAAVQHDVHGLVGSGQVIACDLGIAYMGEKHDKPFRTIHSPVIQITVLYFYFKRFSGIDGKTVEDSLTEMIERTIYIDSGLGACPASLAMKEIRPVSVRRADKDVPNEP